MLPKQDGFGLIPVRSPLLRESLLFSFPTGTKMFQFPAYASVITDNESSTHWVVPFGNSGIKGHLHLHRTYRSLSRPSSPPRAKASTGRPSFAFFLAMNYTSSFALLYIINFCEIVLLSFFRNVKNSTLFLYNMSMNGVLFQGLGWRITDSNR